MKRRARVGLGAVALWLCFAVGCSKPGKPQDVKPVAIMTGPARALKEQLPSEGARFRAYDVNRRENAEHFVNLAGASDDPRVVEASLFAMADSHYAGPGKKRRPDQTFLDSVRRNLASPNGEVRAAALAALKTLLPDAKLSKRGLEAAQATLKTFDDPATRYLLVDALFAAGNRHSVLTRAIAIDALKSSDVATIARSLEYLGTLRWQGPQGKELAPEAFRLSKHDDAAVHGRSLDLMAALGQRTDEVRAAVDRGLSHRSPFVRARASWAAARLGFQRQLPRLIQLTRDKNSDHIHRPIPSLEGQEANLILQGSAAGQVRAAAIGALQVMSRGGFVPRPGGSASALDANAKLAQDWATHRGG